MTLANVQMPSTDKTMLTHQQEDWKEGNGRMWVYSCKTWNSTFLALNAKGILNNSMGYNILSIMDATKEVDPYGI